MLGGFPVGVSMIFRLAEMWNNLGESVAPYNNFPTQTSLIYFQSYGLDM